MFRIWLNIVGRISPKTAANLALKLFITPRKRTRVPLPEIFFKAELLPLHFNGFALEGFRFNKGGQKKLLVIHGFESSVMNFSSYIQTFVKNGMEIIAVNAQAHGNSEGTTIILPEYMALLEKIEKDFGPFDCYMAHSFGGLALAHLLEKIPDTIGRKAVFIAPATETTSAIEGFFKLMRLNSAIRGYFDQIILKKGGIPPAYFSIRRAAHNIQARILWLHDENDRITPLADALKVKADAHPNIEFHITQGLGHRKIYRDKVIAAKIIDYLTEF